MLFSCAAISAQAQKDITIAPGDTLSFWIIGALDAPRTVPIQADGTVMLPLVGPLSVAGLTISQAREKLATRLRNVPVRIVTQEGRELRIGLRPNEIGLDVAQFRPIYMSGDVNAIGEVEYRPHLTARQAVVKAGGLLRLEFSAANEIPIGLMTQRVRLQQQVDTSTSILQLLAHHYLLLNPDTDLTTEPLLRQIPDLPLTDGVLTQVEMRKTLLEREALNRQNVLKQLEARVDVIESLERSSANSMEIAQSSVERLTKLNDQGLLRTEAMDSARQGFLQSQTRALQAASERLRISLEIARLENEGTTDALEMSEDLLEDVKVELERLQTSKAQLQVLNWNAGQYQPLDEAPRAAEVILTLFRNENGQTTERKIEFDDILLPGDVLNVSLQ
ncbi:polysaccharide biosynthesis/export family protein [Epibacterium ulvae]|uniref:polysaccharide biosynthesis/export family protein n=1 Tax=Epibacterium ulvae TaxID=1156985 RepID=UPI00248FFBB1|nr:polysaccharide biosynthesis/export family protein [Epibacterium ulvae]